MVHYEPPLWTLRCVQRELSKWAYFYIQPSSNFMRLMYSPICLLYHVIQYFRHANFYINRMMAKMITKHLWNHAPPINGEGTYWFQWRPRVSASARQFVSTILLESMGEILLNLHGYITGTSRSGDVDPIFKATGGLRLLNFLRRRRRDRFFYVWYLLNQWMECHQTCMDISLGHA